MFTAKCIHIMAGATLFTLLQFISLFPAKGEPAPLRIKTSSQASASQRGYVPPVGRARIQRSDGAGSRGCPRGAFGALSLLAPTDHVGLTVSARPTFSWYVKAVPSTAMQFALVEPGVSKPLLVKQLKVDKPGIIQLELPQNRPELTVGKEYRWTVSLVCNTKRPSENIYVRSWIVRVPKTDVETLRDFRSISDRAAFYAQSGLWYDAVATISQAYLRNPQDSLNANYLRMLLLQVGLSGVASAQLQ